MSSPKGNSKHPQSFMYKDGESKLVEQSEVEKHMADGWCDNPAEEAAVSAEVTDAEAPEMDANGKTDADSEPETLEEAIIAEETAEVEEPVDEETDTDEEGSPIEPEG